jgi:hypothetical protein
MSVIFFHIVPDDFETKCELMMWGEELEKRFFLVQMVMDNDFQRKFDVNAKFASRRIFVVTEKRYIHG